MLDLAELTGLFRKLGANNSEEWAASQVNERVNQLGRFLFLKQAWTKIIDENDHSCVSEKLRDPDGILTLPIQV